MTLKMINIGFGNIVSAGRVVAIVAPDAAPVKRIVQDARERSVLVDATCGRRTRAVIVTDSGHIILSALLPETIMHRLDSKEIIAEDEEEETSSASGAASTAVGFFLKSRPRRVLSFFICRSRTSIPLSSAGREISRSWFSVRSVWPM